MTASQHANAIDDLEKKLMGLAPEILTHAREEGYRNVGVLKFRVGNQADGSTDSAMGRRLADKLEMALILKNDPSDQVGIARHASEHAATINDASHLSVTGRRQLFTSAYPMSWGTRPRQLDAFYTGTALIHEDLSKVTLLVQVVDPNISTLTSVKLIEFSPDIDDLVDAGTSFRVRGIFDKAKMHLSDNERKEEATKQAVLTSLKTTSSSDAAKEHHPLSTKHPDAPVRLEVHYDGTPQAITFSGGQAFVTEPREGQSVEFVIKRPDEKRPRLAIVFKVNGENTLRKQTLPDSKCGAWIFEPSMDIFSIKGFQMENNYREPFQVLSQNESTAQEIDYGEHAGTLSITVFRERPTTSGSEPTSKTASKPSTIGKLFEGEDFALLNDAMHPKKSPSTLATLQSELDPSKHLAKRGLIVGNDHQIEAKVKKTTFKRDTIPLMSATLRYRSPSDLPE